MPFWKNIKHWLNELIDAWFTASLWERFLIPILVIGLFFLLVYLLLPYYKVTNIYGFKRAWFEIESMLPRPQSYLIDDGSIIWSPINHLFSDIPMRYEHQIFPGIIVIILIFLGLLWKFKSENRAIAFNHFWAVVILIALTLNLNGFSLYKVIALLPGFNSVRAVTRIQLVLMWPIALFIACVMDAMLASTKRKILLYSFAFLTVGIMVIKSTMFNHYVLSKSYAQSRLVQLRAQLPSIIPKDPILFVGNTHSKDQVWIGTETEIDGIMLSQELGWPTLNGYSGNVPPNFSMTTESCDQLPKRISNYMNFENITDQSYYFNIMQRVVLIGFTDCNPKWWTNKDMPITSYPGPLPTDMFTGVSLKIDSIENGVTDESASVKIEVSNNSSYNLPALSSTGNPFRLSWRFIDVKNNQPLSGFDTRKDLDFDIPAGSKSVVQTEINPPPEIGQYRIEVSAVQEGVAWFHLNGMPTALSIQIIAVDRSGNYSISSDTGTKLKP